MKLHADFSVNPDKYVFRNHHGDVITEKKGFWTWIKAHVLDSRDYRLSNILKGLENVPLEKNEKKALIQRINIEKYIKKHPDQTSLAEIFKKITQLEQDPEIHTPAPKSGLKPDVNLTTPKDQKPIKLQPSLTSVALSSQAVDLPERIDRLQALLNVHKIPLNLKDPSLSLEQPNRILKENVDAYLNSQNDSLSTNSNVREAVHKYFHSSDLITFDELKRGLQSCSLALKEMLGSESFAIGLAPHTAYSWSAALALPYLDTAPQGHFPVKDEAAFNVSAIKNYVIFGDIHYDEYDLQSIIENNVKELKGDPTKHLYLVVPFTSEYGRKKLKLFLDDHKLGNQVSLITTNRSVVAMEDKMSVEETRFLINFSRRKIDQMRDWDAEYFQQGDRKRTQDRLNRYVSFTEWYIPPDSLQAIPETLKYIKKAGNETSVFEETSFVTNFEPPYKENRKNGNQPFVVPPPKYTTDLDGID